MTAFLQSANSRNESCHITQRSWERVWNCQITVSNPSLVTGLQQHNLPCPQPQLQPLSSDLHQSYSCISSTRERKRECHKNKLINVEGETITFLNAKYSEKEGKIILKWITNTPQTNCKCVDDSEGKINNKLLYRAVIEPAPSRISIPSGWAFNGSRPAAAKPL